jgi:hypothetical protein
MAALAVWTLMVLLILPYKRLMAVKNRRAKVDDFKFGESANVPADVSIPNRHLMNLLELPVLFYVACLTLVITLRVDAGYIYLAWAFFFARVAHSFVHLTYNNVIHRLQTFALSNLILTVIWLRLLFSLL